MPTWRPNAHCHNDHYRADARWLSVALDALGLLRPCAQRLLRLGAASIGGAVMGIMTEDGRTMPSMGFTYGEQRPTAILVECEKCHTLVPEHEIFAGVCRKCPPPRVKEITNEPR